MPNIEAHTERFEAERTRRRAIAYRMLGSLSEAEDAVQETWLRLSRGGAHEIENLPAWLTTVVTRVCLNMLEGRRVRREAPLEGSETGPEVSVATLDPEHEAGLADSVGVALPVVLETLSPPERVAFVLHDLFSVPFDEIAEIVGRSTVAVRQLASRARRRVAGRPGPPSAPAPRRRRAGGPAAPPPPPPPAREGGTCSAPSTRPRGRASSSVCWSCSTP